jgi:hypothetical protein
MSERRAKHAFFSSGFEYMFKPGRQEVVDIAAWGGKGSLDIESCGGVHAWTAEDIPFILTLLFNYSDRHDVGPVPNFSSYPKTLVGTAKLALALREMPEIRFGCHWSYYLGCLLYHQLLYCALPLKVQYEV